MDTYFFIFILLAFLALTFAGNVREDLFMNRPCFRHQYRCLNDKCIGRQQMCNGYDDCGDNSDENHCFTPTVCPGDYFTCRTHHHNYGKCIPKTWKCDEVSDCYNSHDEQDCTVPNVPFQVTASNLTRALIKAKSWIKSQRHPKRRIHKWGSSIARKAVALHLLDNTIFQKSNNFSDEIPYELDISLLSKLALKKIEDLPTSDLASYINAFLVTCIDPRTFYVLDLVKELRNRVDSMNSTYPYAYLTLCNAHETITNTDIEKLIAAFSKAEEEFRTDTQAMIVLALSCAASQSENLIDSTKLSELTLELKKKQYRNGTVENIKTTALIMQALFASESKTDEDNFDERRAIFQILQSQNYDGSFGSLATTYYVIPVLSYLSLVNISSSHCPTVYKTEEEVLQYLKLQIGEKWNIKFSIVIGENKILQRSMVLNVPARTSFYNVMEYAAELDEKYRFQYNVRNRKPYVYALSEIIDDPETEMFWTPYYADTKETKEWKLITESPADVIPENNDHLIFWYKRRA